MLSMDFIYNDGGRAEAGFKGATGDCVTRAIAIATGVPYREVYDALNTLAKRERPTKRTKGRRSKSRDGVYRKTYDKYLQSLGWTFVPTMHIGSGCKVHFTAGELPLGRLIVRLSGHITTVIDRVVHDTYNPQRGATYYYKPKPGGAGVVLDHVSPDRCVYGYYIKAEG